MKVRSARDLAAIVKGRRQDQALSQARLATRAGVARKSISELESGKSEPALRLTLRVLEALGLVLEVSVGRTSARQSKRAVDLDKVLEALRRK